MPATDRTGYLQQIPVFALRKLLVERYPDEKDEDILIERFRTALGRKTQQARNAVKRLNRQELTRLINACPEIDDIEIQNTFEQYRYGSNPSFYIYLFDPNLLSSEQLHDFENRFAQALMDDSQIIADNGDDDISRIRGLKLIDFISLDTEQELFEGTYRFLNRIDFIDADQNASSVYETMYGFFWIGAEEGYITIHARKPQVLRILREAIAETTDLTPLPLVMSKQFKNALQFLQQDRLRSSRLHEPNPTAPRYRWLTVSDPNAYDKGYGELEKSYPELRSTRYRVTVGERWTTLTMHLYRGSMSLAGRLQASEFRAWAIKSLQEVKRVLLGLQAIPAQFIEASGIRQAPALIAYPSANEKNLLLDLFSDLVSLKMGGQEMRALTPSTIELAQVLKREFFIQLPLSCSEDEEETLLACPVCDEINLALSEENGRYQLTCSRPQKHWKIELPYQVKLECEHPLPIDEEYLSRELLMLPNARLMGTVDQLFNKHMPDLSFDSLNEAFYIRGSTIHYHPDNILKMMVFDPRQQVVIKKLHQQIGENKGTVIAVQI